jgi:hypothetical protein
MTRTPKSTDASCTSINVVRRMVAPLVGLLLSLPSTAHGQSLALVSARDHLEGSMLAAQSVYADETRIYLATVQGTLFVLGRDRATNFPLLESIHYTSALYAVRGDAENVYVAAGDGNLLVYRKDQQLTLVQTLPLAANSLSSLAVTGDRVFVAIGLSARFAVNNGRVYLATSNDGELLIELSKPALTPVRTYSKAADENKTVAFDRLTGARVAETTAVYWSLYASELSVIGTDPGCCDAGIPVHDANSLALDQFIVRGGSNTVVERNGLLMAGNESGLVDAFDMASNPSSLVATLNLRQLTGHTGIEDIEIRALWADNLDDLIFAGSSWGNDQSRGPLLPSFFVLETVSSAGLLKSSPASQTTGQTTSPTLRWNASSGATRYEYCYDTVNNDTCDGSWRDAGTSLSVALSALSDGATYYWQVRAVYGAATTEADSGAWWAFQINSDTTPPAVTSVTPASSTTGINAASVVTATFSEAIDGATITPGTFVLRNPANAVVAAMVSYSVAHFATLTPTAPLAGSTTYTATITGSSSGVRDLAGNPLASNVVWSFTTGDTAAPTVVAVTPANGASGVSAASVLTATFSEAIAGATLNASTFVLRNPANVVVTATVSYNTGTRVGTLTAAAALAASTTYTARIAGGGSGVKDAAGNALASDVVWSFTTSGTTGSAAAVGLTTIGSSLDSGDSNALNGSKVKTSAGGRIASMSVFVGSVDARLANRQYQLAIYTDNAGRPGTLVAKSATGTLVGNAWNTLAVSASVQSNTKYWLMYNTNGRSGAVNNMRFISGSAGQGTFSTAPVTFGTWPALAPAATIDNLAFSVFATFAP